MLKPHLLLTALVFALVIGFGVHLATRQSGRLSSGTTTGPAGNVQTNNTPSGNGYSSGDGYRRNYGNNRDEGVPGQFDYYALVLSWSPSYCADRGEDDNAQCNRRDGRRYSFVLHGLWPQYDYGYPSSCRLPRRPFVPESVITNMQDIMPSRGLVVHEYRTHGTCSGLDPAQYFATAHRLFDTIDIPQQFRNPLDEQYLSPSDIRSAFLRTNPQLKPDMIAIVCGGASKGLKEVRICFSKNGQPRSCGHNENQRKLCSAERVSVPPTRSTVREEAPDRRNMPAPGRIDRQSPLPGPRMNYDYSRQNE
ncbi:ribonuclease T2 [Hyphomicrobium sp.]|jgi:ribonuclease T2|uniref:ribonuclease T2 n=1 Tax=Hyphomicrobium sp. TaxID=82 RepID=UPI002BFD2645|nr:ribonuclease T2 [Hyphomicrobium sp.]HVZ04137.1 ribonuclease T2 [Hyphomicrobium sp.]